jgi:hypothetical protein
MKLLYPSHNLLIYGSKMIIQLSGTQWTVLCWMCFTLCQETRYPGPFTLLNQHWLFTWIHCNSIWYLLCKKRVPMTCFNISSFPPWNEMHFLDHQFPEKWICRGGPITWPSCSSNLTPLDFFFFFGHTLRMLCRHLHWLPFCQNLPNG